MKNRVPHTSLRAKRSNPYRRTRKGGLLRRFAPRNDGKGAGDAYARPASVPQPLLAAAVDLAAHQRDRLLINTRGVPGLDGSKIRLARLVARAGAPAMRLQKVRG